MVSTSIPPTSILAQQLAEARNTFGEIQIEDLFKRIDFDRVAKGAIELLGVPSAFLEGSDEAPAPWPWRRRLRFWFGERIIAVGVWLMGKDAPYME